MEGRKSGHTKFFIHHFHYKRIAMGPAYMPTGGHAVNTAALPGFLTWAALILMMMALVWLLERR